MRSSSRESEEEKQKLPWKRELVPLFLGYGAGAFCFLSKSGRRREKGVSCRGERRDLDEAGGGAAAARNGESLR